MQYLRLQRIIDLMRLGSHLVFSPLSVWHVERVVVCSRQSDPLADQMKTVWEARQWGRGAPRSDGGS